MAASYWHERDMKSMHRSWYRYDSLADPINGIRLLELHPARNHDAHIQCSITTTTLGDVPAYEALSYVWGVPNLSEEISCNGYRLDITPNLNNALKHLRYADRKRVLYVDAVCINQNDLEERESQVKIMADIFHAAHAVVIWLGDDPKLLARFAFQRMGEYANFVESLLETVRPPAHDPNDFSRYAALEIMDFRTWQSSIPGVSAYGSIKDILNRPWWDRVWVLQEAAVTRRAMVTCGHASMNLRDLVLFVYGLRFHTPWEYIRLLNINRIYETFEFIWAGYRYMDTWASHMPFVLNSGLDSLGFWPLSSLLEVTVQRQITDRRDHVYALLGHPAFRSKDREDALIEPDYSLSYQQLCRELTTACLQLKGDFSMLNLVQFGRNNSSSTAPSWVPNLTLLSSVIDHGFYKAGLAFEPEIEIDDTRLRVRGVNVGTVTTPVDAFPYESETRSGSGQTISATNFTRVLLQVLQFDVTPEQLRAHGRLSRLRFWMALLVVPHLNIQDYDDEINRQLGLARDALNSLLIRRVSSRMHEGLSELELQTELRDSHLRVRPFDGFTNHDSNEFGQLLQICSNKRVFRTQGGLWGIGPGTMTDGDICVVIHGARTPFMLRPTRGGSRNEYTLVGECLVPGLMYGEVGEMKRMHDRREEVFTIC